MEVRPKLLIESLIQSDVVVSCDYNLGLEVCLLEPLDRFGELYCFLLVVRGVQAHGHWPYLIAVMDKGGGFMGNSRRGLLALNMDIKGKIPPLSNFLGLSNRLRATAHRLWEA